MLKRLWKKVKGSHPEPCHTDREGVTHVAKEDAQTETEGTPVSDPEYQSEDTQENAAVTAYKPGKSEGKDIVWEPNQVLDDNGEVDGEASVSSEASASSSSSSEGYYSMVENEQIVVPSRKNADRETSGAKEERSPHTTSESEEEDKPRFDLKLLAMTQFPDFDLESLPEGEWTDGSDDDSTVRKKEEAYATKEDQDVAVFMDIAKRLAMKSLLHLLQGHVRSQQNLPSSYLQQYNQALTATGNDSESMPSSLKYPSAPAENKPLQRKKQFRWAEVTDAKVRAVVYEIESLKGNRDMWWSPTEMNTIRKDLIDVVQFFRRRRPNYVTSVEIVARGNQAESVIEDHMKQLMADSFPRGLETHIVKMLSDHRRSTIQAVLDEQKECRSCNDTPECTMHCMREQSLAYSVMSSRFAVNMGKCDEIDALKAGMSRWRAGAALADPNFFTS